MSFGSLSPGPSLGPARSLIMNLEKQALKKKKKKKIKKANWKTTGFKSRKK